MCYEALTGLVAVLCFFHFLTKRDFIITITNLLFRIKWLIDFDNKVTYVDSDGYRELLAFAPKTIMIDSVEMRLLKAKLWRGIIFISTYIQKSHPLY